MSKIVYLVWWSAIWFAPTSNAYISQVQVFLEPHTRQEVVLYGNTLEHVPTKAVSQQTQRVIEKLEAFVKSARPVSVLFEGIIPSERFDQIKVLRPTCLLVNITNLFRQLIRTPFRERMMNIEMRDFLFDGTWDYLVLKDCIADLSSQDLVDDQQRRALTVYQEELGKEKYDIFRDKTDDELYITILENLKKTAQGFMERCQSLIQERIDVLKPTADRLENIYKKIPHTTRLLQRFEQVQSRMTDELLKIANLETDSLEELIPATQRLLQIKIWLNIVLNPGERKIIVVTGCEHLPYLAELLADSGYRDIYTMRRLLSTVSDTIDTSKAVKPTDQRYELEELSDLELNFIC